MPNQIIINIQTNGKTHAVINQSKVAIFVSRISRYRRYVPYYADVIQLTTIIRTTDQLYVHNIILPLIVSVPYPLTLCCIRPGITNFYCAFEALLATNIDVTRHPFTWKRLHDG